MAAQIENLQEESNISENEPNLVESIIKTYIFYALVLIPLLAFIWFLLKVFRQIQDKPKVTQLTLKFTKKFESLKKNLKKVIKEADLSTIPVKNAEILQEKLKSLDNYKKAMYQDFHLIFEYLKNKNEFNRSVSFKGMVLGFGEMEAFFRENSYNLILELNSKPEEIPSIFKVYFTNSTEILKAAEEFEVKFKNYFKNSNKFY